MIEASCHCKNSVLKACIAPESITSCNCSICYRLGALWAYYTEDQVDVRYELTPTLYLWGEKQRTYHVCPCCGCTTHYTQNRDDGTKRLAMNVRMVNAELFKFTPVKKFDGANTFKFL